MRDALLGRTVKDRDWVVLGSTPEAMLEAGFLPVGRDFPVFLHPQTREEHALARTERKSAAGYRGFVVHAAPDVTLEDDLRRRDFTINAIAQDESGALIDPFGGQRDLQARVLRHVSPAFAEDPVRILRAARFMARYAPLGFRVAEATLQLMRDMVQAGEVDHLVPERIWQELHAALAEAQPSACLQTLRACGALQRILPEVDALYGVEQRIEFHPEVDAGIHTEMVLDVSARLAPGDGLIGFCGLTHDLGKALTPAHVRPKHIGHEQTGVHPLRALAKRLRVPAEYLAQAEIVCREHLNVHRLDELRDDTVLKLIERCDGFRKPERIDRLGLCCEIDKRGRLGCTETDYPPRAELNRLHAAARAVQVADLEVQGLSGEAIGATLRAARLRAITAARRAPATAR